MWRMQPKQLLSEPSLNIPPSIDQVINLIQYFRKLTSADKDFGYKACMKVNRDLLKYVREIYPEMEVGLLFCKNFRGTRRSPDVIVEHYAGAINTNEGWIWFDGTADQLVSTSSGAIIVKKVLSKEEVLSSIQDTIGGIWRFENI